MFHVLHITNDFGGTEVYRNLYQHLDELGIRQTVFVPLNSRVRYRKGNHDFIFKTDGSKIIYSINLKWYHRYLYNLKISRVVRDVVEMVNLDEISLIHASTVCMTGAVAFEISNQVKKKFIVTVRNTDINTYFKKMKWKRGYFNTILENASFVLFISKQYKLDCFQKHFNKSVVQNIEMKNKVIPNGIDSYFLKNKPILQKTLNTPIELVFAGGYRNNKNLLRLIEAVDLLQSNKFNVRLKAIGRSLPNRSVNKRYLQSLECAAKNKDYIQLIEYQDKEGLCKFFSNANIFVMPSIHETFGLSYAEALSQGLPIIYTRGQGFDGFFKEGEVGFAVDALNVHDIAKGIEFAITNYSNLAQNVVNLDISKYFDWKDIAVKYQNLYNAIIKV